MVMVDQPMKRGKRTVQTVVEFPCPKCNSIDRRDGQNKIPQLEMVLENKKWMVTCHKCDFKESIFSDTFRDRGNYNSR